MSGILLLRRSLCARRLSCRLSQVRYYALIGKPKAKSEPAWALPKYPARTRFAPSPTGYLHLGSLRTALFNYLLAKATGGQFIIRLEDTDRTRFVQDAEQRLYDDMRWAGLEWDEGPDKGGIYGSYKQSERLALYHQHAESLLESGHAFRCFCSKEDLEFNISQATARGSAARYPGTCRNIGKGESDRRAANGEPHVLRFKASKEAVVAPDLIYGAYKKGETEDDFIIMKSDGFPTYHFANVVDDHFMKITHVIRGAEWLISTPKHIELYNAFGWQPPTFAHVGLLVDQQRQKLSKRDIDSIGISVYRDHRVMPLAVLNFAVQLGWDPRLQDKPELQKARGVLTLDQMKENFSLKFTRGDIIVDLGKLNFFQSRIWQGVMSGTIDEPPSFRQQFVDPVIAELTQIEQDINARLENRSVAHPDFLDSIAAADYIDMIRKNRTPEFVFQVLKAWKGNVEDYATCVRDCIYAFVRPSRKAYLRGLREFEPAIRKVRIFENDDYGGVHSDISAVLKWLRSQFSLVSAEDWNQSHLDTYVKQTVGKISYVDHDEKVEKKGAAGWQFLRWGLLNSQPRLGLVPIMVLLGPEEVDRRLVLAARAAVNEEDSITKSPRQEDSPDAFRKIYVQGPGNDLEHEQASSGTLDPLRKMERELESLSLKEPPGGRYSTQHKAAEELDKSMRPKLKPDDHREHIQDGSKVHHQRPEVADNEREETGPFGLPRLQPKLGPYHLGKAILERQKHVERVKRLHQQLTMQREVHERLAVLQALKPGPLNPAANSLPFERPPTRFYPASFRNKDGEKKFYPPKTFRYGKGT